MIVTVGSPDSQTTLTNLQKEDVQTNGCDVRIGKLYRYVDGSEFVIDAENNKQHRKTVEMIPDSDGFWVLEPHTSYEWIAENEVDVPMTESSYIITRSTLNRNGVFLTSGWYDGNYKGVIAGVIHNVVGVTKIQKGTRVGQLISWESKGYKPYEGSYGKNSSHDKMKYQ